MRRWQALGRFIGEHLMVIVPAGVAIGIAFPELLLPIKPLVPTLFAVMTLQNSLSNDLRSMAVALRRPAALVVTILMVHVAMPLATFAVASLVFGADSPTVAGVVLEYSVPIGASTVMWIGMFAGELALGLSTLLLSTLISPATIPATLQLTRKDIAYRANAASIKAFVCVNDPYVMEQMELARPDAPCIQDIYVTNENKEGWINFDEEFVKYPETLERPAGDAATKNTDIMQIYFTSGTTGMPKMVCHNYDHPLGHIVTAKYWQQVQENKLHMSVSDSGWAKFGWGKIYGQWICGATIFAYDMDRFHANNLLAMIEKYRLTTFCAPPTMYRFMLQEDVASYDLSSVEHWATAGEPLNPEVFNRWEELTGHKIASGFGQTEGTVLIANFPWFEAKPGTLGKLSPIYDIHLMNSDGKECEQGEEGEICICGIRENPPVGLFVGYYRNKELTEDALGSGVYNLKDVAWIRTDITGLSDVMTTLSSVPVTVSDLLK